MMKVPLLDLKAQLLPLRDEILEAVTDVIDSTQYILGDKVRLLEEHVASYCGTNHGVGVSSGTDALLAALMALGVGPGDLVLTTPYTFIATMGSVLRLGARPVFVDIDPVTFNISPDRMAEVLASDPAQTEKIKVVLPVHLYGQCADMGRIMELAGHYGIAVLEDAAQAIGASCPCIDQGEMNWKRAGALGDAGCFSFFPSKNLGGVGDGGMIVCNNDKLAHDIRIIRVHGGAPKYYHAVVGGNFRLDPMQAAVLEIKLSHLPDWHRARRRNAQIYDRLFAEAGLIANGSVEIPQAVYQGQAEKESYDPDYHIYNQYVVRVKDRDSLKNFLFEKNVGAEIYYPVPLHKQKVVENLGYNDLCFPEAERAAAETLALPIYPELTEEMLAYVVDRIAQFFK